MKPVLRKATILFLALSLLEPFSLAQVQAAESQSNSSALQPTFDTTEAQQTSAFIKKPPVVQKLAKEHYRSDEDITLSVTNTQNQPIKVAVLDVEGKKADVDIEQTKSSNQVAIDIAPQSQFRPGKYTVVVTDQEGKSSKQDFRWGVLAINPNRSMYQPGQTAKIAMAVLDDQGNMVCDAKLVLEIQHKDETILSTENKKIIVNPECTSHSFTLNPDYETTYQIADAGTYTMTLTAQTKNGSYTISDQFRAAEDVPFDVERTSATRIYPPNNYPVHLKVTAKQDFTGIVTETVPDSFVITPSSQEDSYTTAQTLYLEDHKDPESDLQDVLGAATTASTSGLLLPFADAFSITQGFGTSKTEDILSKFYQHYSLAGHDGIDFGLPENTPLFAVDEGNIIWAEPGDYGITVIIQHTWGKSYYGHLNKVTIGKGQHIMKGTQIGLSGNTGESTGPHLHFGIKPNDPDMENGYFGKVDPLPYFKLPETTLVAKNSQAVITSTAVLGTQTSASASADFTIKEEQLRSEEMDAITSPTEKVKVIQWQVTLKKGETKTLSYEFKAPPISPQFYLLGPLRFYPSDNEEPIFEEVRQWQIAGDAIGARWYNYDWQYRKQITIDNAQVSSTQTDFPVLINRTTDDDLADNAQTDGDDIVFTDASGTKLSHEIERYTTATGELIAWVKVPSLSASTDTTLYVYYGNPSVSNQENVSNVWSNNFTSVWHLREDPTATCSGTKEFCDSVATNDGDANGTMTAGDRITGQIGYGTDFDGINDYISTTTSYNDPQHLTVSTWVKTTSAAGRKVFGFENTQTGTGGQAYDRHIYVNTSGKAVVGSYDGEPPDRAVSTASVNTGTWQYVVGTLDNNNDIVSVYVNGATPQTVASTIAQSATGYWRIGSYKLAGWLGGSDGYFTGQVDEPRVATGVRSQGWITTEYNNQSSPATFYSVGSVETKIDSVTNQELMRHGQFLYNGTPQPFLF